VTFFRDTRGINGNRGTWQSSSWSFLPSTQVVDDPKPVGEYMLAQNSSTIRKDGSQSRGELLILEMCFKEEGLYYRYSLSVVPW